MRLNNFRYCAAVFLSLLSCSVIADPDPDDPGWVTLDNAAQFTDRAPFKHPSLTFRVGEIYRTPLSGRLLYVNAINPETREICFSLGDNDCHDFANYNGIDAVSLIARPAVEGQQVWEEVTALDLAFPETILPESNKDKVKEK